MRNIEDKKIKVDSTRDFSTEGGRRVKKGGDDVRRPGGLMPMPIIVEQAISETP